MNFADIREKLAPLKWGQLRQLAQEAGLPFHTVRKIASGETADPRVSTTEALARHFKSRPKSRAA
jgi:hypothetical protein